MQLITIDRPYSVSCEGFQHEDFEISKESDYDLNNLSKSENDINCYIQLNEDIHHLIFLHLGIENCHSFMMTSKAIYFIGKRSGIWKACLPSPDISLDGKTSCYPHAKSWSIQKASEVKRLWKNLYYAVILEVDVECELSHGYATDFANERSCVRLAQTFFSWLKKNKEEILSLEGMKWGFREEPSINGMHFFCKIDMLSAAPHLKMQMGKVIILKIFDSLIGSFTSLSSFKWLELATQMIVITDEYEKFIYLNKLLNFFRQFAPVLIKDELAYL